MKVHKETINEYGKRTQTVKWRGEHWEIRCNDRFDKGDFKIDFKCDLCAPTFVPKVILYNGYYLCVACLTRMIEMLQAAGLEDCSRNLEQVKTLEIQMKKTLSYPEFVALPIVAKKDGI